MAMQEGRVAVPRSVPGMFMRHCIQVFENVFGIHALVYFVVDGTCEKAQEIDIFTDPFLFERLKSKKINASSKFFYQDIVSPILPTVT